MKKQNFIITSLFLFWVIGTTTAQTITGKVTNIHAQAIDGATVILQTIDSTFVDAVITDTTGYFRFNRQPASYRLIFQHIMYETLLLTTTGEDAGTITLKSKDYALDEVIVKGERPLVKVEEGKLSYDLSQLTTHRIVNNAYEILQQLPGVQEINGNLSLAGTHNLNIILNGRPTTMSHEQLTILLKNTPASRVEKAEIMYSTPPQYHVRGAAINLLLKDLFTMLPQFKTQTEQDVEEEFKKDSEKQNILEIKVSTLYGQLIQNLLEIHNNGKLYGIRNEDGTCSYTMANNFYENKEHYMSGKSTGVGYAIKHKHTNPGEDEVDTFQGIKFRQVKPIENVPFETIIGTEVYLSRDDFEEFVKTNQNYSNMDELGIKFQNLIAIKGQKIEHKEKNKEIKYRETSLFDFL
jgi:hypothetical protein